MSSSNSDNSRPSAEVEHLNKLEAIVRRGLDADVEVGNALAEINDTWLYRATHETFEAYVRDRWGMSPTLAEELIQAAEAAGPPPARRAPSGPPPPTRARPAPRMQLPGRPIAPGRRDGPDGLAKVWERARREFGGEDVAAVEIRLTVHKRRQPPPLEPHPRPASR